MGLPIEKWARQATILDPPPRRVLDDINDLAEFERRFWFERNRKLVKEEVPIALQGGFAGFPNVPPAAALSTVTTISGTVALWTSSLHSPISANAVQSPQGYRVAASGLYTTSTTPGNVQWDPRVGTGSTINTAISGTTMGASASTALTASITNAGWRLEGDLTIRSIGGPGANSSVIFFGTMKWTNAAFPASWANVHGFGGTAASVDLSTTAGFSLGFVSTVTTITVVTHQVHWTSWN